MQITKIMFRAFSFYFNTLPKLLFFPLGIGDVQISSGNSGGVVAILVVKKWKFRGGVKGGGGGLCEIPSVVGVWIFPGTTQCIVMQVIYRLEFGAYHNSWQTLINFRRIRRILQISESVIHLGLQPRWITPSLICRILHILLSLIQ